MSRSERGMGRVASRSSRAQYQSSAANSLPEMSPRGVHADGQEPDGDYRHVRQLPP